MRCATGGAISSSISKAFRRRPPTSACSSWATTRSTTLARPGHRLARAAPKAASFAASGHIAVHGLPALDLVDRELAAHKLAATVTSRVSSLLSGLLLALSSDAFITVPESLAASLEKQFGFKRVRQPFPPILFPLRLMWHSSYDRDECHAWVRAELAKLAGERHVTG